MRKLLTALAIASIALAGCSKPAPAVPPPAENVAEITLVKNCGSFWIIRQNGELLADFGDSHSKYYRIDSATNFQDICKDPT